MTNSTMWDLVLIFYNDVDTWFEKAPCI